VPESGFGGNLSCRQNLEGCSRWMDWQWQKPGSRTWWVCAVVHVVDFVQQNGDGQS